jgi:hypothetical protein
VAETVRLLSSIVDGGRRSPTISIRYPCNGLGRTRTLDSHASRLRRKLNTNGECAYVLNVWGVGYRLVAGS